MSALLSSITPEHLSEWVHGALNRLYDSAYLDKHPLAKLLMADQPAITQPGQTLRRKLLDAIRDLRPGPGVPAQSPDWRAYRILELRYIEGREAADVMRQLGLGRSQYYSEQARALERLTATLWDRLALTPRRRAEPNAADGSSRQELAHSEVERLIAQATWETVDLVELLRELEGILAPLAAAKGVALRFDLSCPLRITHADRVMLRQTCLNVVAYALDVVAGGRVEVHSYSNELEFGICISAWGGPVGPPSEAQPSRQGLGLDIGRQLMLANRGMLRVEGGQHRWSAYLAWALTSTRLLLVVDDNQGFINLCRRYLAAQRWQVLSATSASEARRVIVQTRPTVILLDVMMPREDGWELLTWLKTEPTTRNLPVIVCSVVNEPQLAQTLGATAYLTKPVTQERLLRALQPWTLAGVGDETGS